MNRESWRTRIKYLGYVISVYVIVLFFWYMNKNSTSISFVDTMNFLNVQGEYSLDGQDFMPITDNEEMYGTNSSSLVMRGHFSSNVPKGKSLFMYGENLEIKIFINDELLFSALYDGTDPWMECVSPGIKTSDNVEIDIHTVKSYNVNKNFKLFLMRFCATTKYDLIKYQITRHFPSIFLAFIIMITGISMWINRYQMLYLEKEDLGYRISGGMVLVLGSICCLLDYSYISLLVYNVYILKYVDVMCESLTCIFLASYLRRYLVKKTHKIAGNVILHVMKVVLVLFMLNRIFVERITKVDDIVIWVMACGSILIVAEIICMLRENVKSGVELKVASYTTLLVVISFLIEMVYFLMTGRYFIYIFEAAMCIFGLVHYNLISQSNTSNFLKAQKAQELENELIQSQIKIMLSQIQPHFLYNALGTIRALTTKEPEKAKDALTYFAKYLRANMDSLNEKGCIPFKKELEHVESYLHVEKLRFGDKLNVEYDINTTNFECPPLMLQTMVENAVKHGLQEKAEGGTVKISTNETERFYEIKIEDDGVGFDMSKPLDNSRSHIGVENTRKRLTGMCNGSLSVGSKIGEGTTISIIIPKKTE